MRQKDREAFLLKIETMEPEELTDRHVELAAEVCMSAKKQGAHVSELEKVVELLWKITSMNDRCALSVTQRAAKSFSEVVMALDTSSKLQYLEKLAERLGSGQQTHLTIKILAQLLKAAFDPPQNHPELETLSDVVEYLETKHNLLESALSDFERYIKIVAKQVAQNPNFELNEQTVIFGDYPHGDQVKQRLEFIKFYARSSPKVQLKAC